MLGFQCYDHAGNNMLDMLFVGIELSSPATTHATLWTERVAPLAGNFLDSFSTSSRELFQPRSAAV